MSPRMWFTLILRYLGASEIFAGLNHFVTAFNVHMGYFQGSASAVAYVNHGVESTVIGAVVLLAAARLSALLVSALPAKFSEPAASASANV
jgi:hypothetical protein